MANILVTGGAGYIGSHVVKMLGELGHDITIIDNLSTGRKESILYGKLLQFDIGDTDKLENVIKEGNFQACLHFAGSIIVPESVTNPIKYYENNTVKTFGLLKLCHNYGVNRFIFSSTAAVYGDSESGVCNEDTPIKPLNAYGTTKYMTECMLEDISRAHSDFNFVVLRYFNVAGGNVDGKLGQCSPLSTHLIKIACETALGKREHMSIYGDDYPTKDGTCIRDYIHIDDLASAHVDSLDYLMNGGKSETMNCGYGKGYTVKEVIEVMKKSCNIDFQVKVGDRREGDCAVLISEANKIKDVLGWEPKYDSLALMCKTAYEWEKKI